MESVEVLNERLINIYGKYEDGQANYRLAWSEDQFENRFGTYNLFDVHGNKIGEHTGWEYAPKYRQWMPSQWVLEILLPVPDFQTQELTTKLTYEPLFGFHAQHTKEETPQWDTIQFIIENVRKAGAEKVRVKYKDPLIDQSDPKIAKEVKEARISAMERDLFGNETDTGDALSYKEGVTVPNNFQSSTVNDD